MFQRFTKLIEFFKVLKLSLYNVSYMNRDKLKRLNELLPRNIPVLCKQALLGNNSVEIFVRTQPNNVFYCVNNAINMEIELAKKYVCICMVNMDYFIMSK